MVPKLCSFPECGKSTHAKGLCQGHYKQVKRGEPLAAIIRYPKFCTAGDCETKSVYFGLCRFHHRRKLWLGDPLAEPPVYPDICIIEDCGRTTSSGGRGWCGMHWKRWRRYGNTADHIVHHTSTEAAYSARTVRVGSCVEWTGYKDQNGYGRFNRGGRGVELVHRYVYELEHGAIPKGMHIDHICHNPSCSNIKHLRLTTPGQNVQNHSGATRASKTGVRGVYPTNRGGYYAQTSYQGKKYTVGTFLTIEEAEAAVIAKRNELHTHNDRDRMSV